MFASLSVVSYGLGTAVVPGLDRRDPVTAVTAMGGIITEARSNPAFVLLLAVTAVLALVVGVFAARRPRQPGGGTLLAGAGFAGLVGAVLFAVGLWRLARGREAAAVG